VDILIINGPRIKDFDYRIHLNYFRSGSCDYRNCHYYADGISHHIDKPLIEKRLFTTSMNRTSSKFKFIVIEQLVSRNICLLNTMLNPFDRI
jgi:hypothetical protein